MEKNSKMTKEMTEEVSKERVYYTTDNLYDDYYLKEHSDEDHKRYLDKETWQKLWKAFAKVGSRRLIEKGDFTLPGSLGKLTIRKHKNKKKPINWAKFRETGKFHYYENEHTDGYLIKCQWIDRPFIASDFFFNFELSRNTKKKLSQAVRENPKLANNYDTLAKTIKRQ